MKALISVSDKTGIVELATKLHQLGVSLVSTGGTAQQLQQAGLPVTEVSELTQFPEMMDGRVKTLHPKIHGGLLARQDVAEHMQAMQQHNIERIDILIVNLYPFVATVAQPNCTLDQAIENIDIGGPAMVRSGAKNWRDVAVVTQVSQYDTLIDELTKGSISQATKFAFAVAAFNQISNYDAAIANYLSSIQLDGSRAQFPQQLNLGLAKKQDLRYGENPHQQAAFYQDLQPQAASLATALQLQGKELSFNNIADTDAAWECVKSFTAPACVIIKHANPCGVAVASNAQQAYEKAFKTDSTSAFGGIIAFNCQFDLAAAQQVIKQFVEVLVAPSFSQEALDLFKTKPNVRILQIKLEQVNNSVQQLDFKRVGSGLLVQTADTHQLERSQVKVVSKRQPTEQQWQDLLFAWTVAKFVKSNAIVYCANGMTLGVGAGQMSRIDSAKIASIKAANAGLSLINSAVASDAFFPFRDGLDVVVAAGASCVIHPGGSIRDDEVIAAADEHDIAMVFTDIRHFRH